MIDKILKKFIRKKSKNKKTSKNITLGNGSVLLKNTSFRYDVNSNNPVTIGNNSMVNCNFIFESDKGEISVGNRCFINVGTNLISRSKIEIGDDVTIAWGCNIYDHNSHSLDWMERKKDIVLQVNNYNNNLPLIAGKNWNSVKSRPIKICDKAWLGFNVTVLNGVTIGEGAIVSACSVVREDVAPWTIVAGNPAKVIGEVRNE